MANGIRNLALITLALSILGGCSRSDMAHVHRKSRGVLAKEDFFAKQCVNCRHIYTAKVRLSPEIEVPVISYGEEALTNNLLYDLGDSVTVKRHNQNKNGLWIYRIESNKNKTRHRQSQPSHLPTRPIHDKNQVMGVEDFEVGKKYQRKRKIGEKVESSLVFEYLGKDPEDSRKVKVKIETERYLADMGMVPYGNGWNAYNYVVPLED